MKKFKKIILPIIMTSLVIFTLGCSKNTTATSENTSSFQDPEQPQRMAEVYGKVKTIQGNMVIISEMVQTQNSQDLTEEQKQKKREEMQSLSEEDRKKLKGESQQLTGKTITITVPVGVPIKIKQSQIEGGEIANGGLNNIETGVIISIWTENSDISNKAPAEYVRISPAIN